ncbi:DUF1376 domain-containing protein [Caulobacter sp. NIBR2454]|uniref:DUF1376 domain-containing protein n=1 Tax=Caulobacter sp. NIBR2454 TaxID=3015996 RepID=UPI0022B6D3A3|nr:DUF1376 domain-containing protein [Caulobacter sp. NIBR2454]
MSELPPPMTPADCDLRGLPFMPLDVVRLLDSDLFALTSGDEFKAAVALWCKSWNQKPAASLPEDDRILAKFVSLSVKDWAKVRDAALRGWVKCNDGRLYHDVVAEKALEAWEERQHHQADREGVKERKRREREERKALFADLRAAGKTAPWDTKMADLRAMVANLEPRPVTTPVTQPVTQPVTVTGHTPVTAIEGTGTVSKSSGDKSPERADPLVDPEKFAWDSAVRLLIERGQMAERGARAFFGKLLSENGLSGRDLAPALTQAAVSGTQDPAAYLRKAAAGVASRRTTTAKPQPNPLNWDEETWRKACQLYDRDGSWETKMGPPPGARGCIVPEHVLAARTKGAA